jgi:NADPH:quinone reductase-like Zn-dependent oxidoreductase
MPSNMAVVLPAKNGKLEIRSAPYTPPRDNEIVVRNHAVAINPVDWAIPIIGDRIFPWIKYPMVLGIDCAGEVVQIGKSVSRFKIGDRVLGHAVGQDENRNNPAEGAFQLYTVLLAHMAAPIPTALAYENAAVLPLGLSTAACGLFQKDFLALQYPGPSPKPTGKTLLVWGGSTSVGSNAIQLAVAAGYEVIATCSPRNFDYVKKLGAAHAFDYNSKTVVEDVIKAFGGKTIAGALAIGAGSSERCLDVVAGSKGYKFVALASPSAISLSALPDRVGLGALLFQLAIPMARSNLVMAIKSRRTGVRTKFIYGGSLKDNEVGPMIYEDFLPGSLAAGRYVAAPDPTVVGQGLEAVQTAFAVQRKGVSATKVVVSL